MSTEKQLFAKRQYLVQDSFRPPRADANTDTNQRFDKFSRQTNTSNGMTRASQVSGRRHARKKFLFLKTLHIFYTEHREADFGMKAPRFTILGTLKSAAVFVPSRHSLKATHERPY